MVSIYDIPEYIQILKKMLIVFMNKMTSYKIPLKLRKEFFQCKAVDPVTGKVYFLILNKIGVVMSVLVYTPNVLLAKQNGENVVKEHLEFLYYHL